PCPLHRTVFTVVTELVLGAQDSAIPIAHSHADPGPPAHHDRQSLAFDRDSGPRGNDHHFLAFHRPRSLAATPILQRDSQRRRSLEGDVAPYIDFRLVLLFMAAARDVQ